MLKRLAVVLSVLLSTALSLGGASEPSSVAFNASAVCGECHQDIYTMWRRSMHASSYTDPIFATSYMQAYMATGGKAQGVCLRCHAPMSTLKEGAALGDSAVQEGIGCDYCHSMVSVDLARRERPFEIKVDGVKRGPISNTESPAHEVARSPLHQSAELCAGCHEYETPEGLGVLTTYSEWKVSPQSAAGKICQDCHMPSTSGKTVRPELGLGRASINLHDISGMHSIEQVRRAATVKVLKVAREQPETAVVLVEVANVGSGHSIPTGLPTRKLVLEVVLLVDSREARRFERVYQKVLLDASGTIITEDYRAFLDSRKLLQDTRLLPGEHRQEKFVTSVPAKGVLQAVVNLRYVYDPLLLSRQPIRIDMADERFP